jgi:hypothetical protein
LLASPVALRGAWREVTLLDALLALGTSLPAEEFVHVLESLYYSDVARRHNRRNAGRKSSQK